ncbi:unnamed protein product [Sphenostylis stenocarpa]|uniref:Uncharacterized protein n=1 Tax=Sphenostylis stenocarpa TaxID=92480 RepID=A0AA86VM14_9FABA|nr:unnamed protein product [Sphenostylis stenocarpa]
MLFLTLLNHTLPSGAKLLKDTTKVSELSGNEPKSRHACISSSRVRLAEINCVTRPSKSFGCSATDRPSFSFKFMSFRFMNIFYCAFFVSYILSSFFQRVWGFVSLDT